MRVADPLSLSEANVGGASSGAEPYVVLVDENIFGRRQLASVGLFSESHGRLETVER